MMRNVKMPNKLLGDARLYIKNHPEKGFISVPELVRYATIRYLRQVKKE